MEYRKLISFGKSSYVVSLPKGWVTRNKLKKGDLIYFDEHSSNLILQPKESNKKTEEQELTISVDGKLIEQIERELIAGYIRNYKTIILRGKEISDKLHPIHQLIHDLIALEVMEQTTDKIVARDFLDMETISIVDLVRKMDTSTRTMMEDAANTFKENTYENVLHRDKDVNRLSFLIYRVIKFGLDHQTFMEKKFNMDVHQLITYQWLTVYLEAVADEVKRTSRYMKFAASLSDKEKRAFEKLYTEIKETYLKTMKAFYNNDKELSYALANKKKSLIEACDEFFLRNQQVPWVAYLINRLKRLVSSIHKLGRIIYQ